MLDSEGVILDRVNIIGDIVELIEVLIEMDYESRSQEMIVDKLCRFINSYGYPFNFNGETKVRPDMILPLFHFYCLFILTNELSKEIPDMETMIEHLNYIISGDARIFNEGNDILTIQLPELINKGYHSLSK